MGNIRLKIEISKKSYMDALSLKDYVDEANNVRSEILKQIAKEDLQGKLDPEIEVILRYSVSKHTDLTEGSLI